MFAAAEFGREVIHAVFQADTVEELLRTRLRVFPADHRGEQDIFERGELWQEEVGLENKTHALIAKPGQSVSGKPVK